MHFKRIIHVRIHKARIQRNETAAHNPFCANINHFFLHPLDNTGKGEEAPFSSENSGGLPLRLRNIWTCILGIGTAIIRDADPPKKTIQAGIGPRQLPLLDSSLSPISRYRLANGLSIIIKCKFSELLFRG